MKTPKHFLTTSTIIQKEHNAPTPRVKMVWHIIICLEFDSQSHGIPVEINWFHYLMPKGFLNLFC